VPPVAELLLLLLLLVLVLLLELSIWSGRLILGLCCCCCCCCCRHNGCDCLLLLLLRLLLLERAAALTPFPGVAWPAALSKSTQPIFPPNNADAAATNCSRTADSNPNRRPPLTLDTHKPLECNSQMQCTKQRTN